MNFTYYGHASFSITGPDYEYLIDPFISPTPVGQQMDIKTLMPTEILLSHGHGDHIYDAEQIANQSQCKVIAMVEVAKWFENKSVKNTLEVNIGARLTLSGSNKVHFVSACHSSSLPDGSYGGLATGMVFDLQGLQVFYAGDTSLHKDMELIPFWYPQLDWAILPIGGHFTMDVDDAIAAAKMMKVKKIIGVHYNTFPPISIDTEVAKQKFQREGLYLTLLNPLESFSLATISETVQNG